MQKPIYSCIWYNHQATEAADFYTKLFPNSHILQQNPMVSSFELMGTKFMGLNGGPRYKPTPAVSYYVYCGSEQEIERLYAALLVGGNAVMPLGEYDWSKKYAWLCDKFGVYWQLDIQAIEAPQKIVPTLLFANDKFPKLKEAVYQYVQIFDNSSVKIESPYPAHFNFPEERLLFCQYQLGSILFNAISSHNAHDFDFSPGNSFVVECDTQEEIDYYWENLGKNGRYDQCGWLADQYGVSWQIVPSILPKLMSDPAKSKNVVQAFMKMQKFDIQTLVDA